MSYNGKEQEVGRPNLNTNLDWLQLKLY